MMNSELINRTNKPTSDSRLPSNSNPKPANPIRHMLREGAPFLLIGVTIATLFFHFLLPSPSSSITLPSDSFLETELPLPTRRVLFEDENKDQKEGVSVKRRVPLSVELKGKKGKRVLVTGGAGFVGSHLVDRLMERGDSVIVVDNFFTGRKENVLHHLGNPNFELIRHDVVEPILLEVDQIYHLACPASPVHYKFNPIKTIIS